MCANCPTLRKGEGCFLVRTGLRNKRFQSSYYARGGAREKKTKGRGREEEEARASKHHDWRKRPFKFICRRARQHSSQYNVTDEQNRLPDL